MLCPSSCKHKLSEWAKQWTGRAAGFSFLSCVATPFHTPCIFAAPSNACLLHILRGNMQRVRISLMAFVMVSAFVLGKQKGQVDLQKPHTRHLPTKQTNLTAHNSQHLLPHLLLWNTNWDY